MKYLVIIVLALFGLGFTHSDDDVPLIGKRLVANDPLVTFNRILNETRKDCIIDYAYRFIGTPYKYTGITPKGFDCSGFVNFVFTHHNIIVPRTSRDMGNFGRTIPLDSARKGDIILFKGTNANSKVIGHAGIVTWSDGQDVQFIHSSSNRKHGGVIVSCYSDSPYYSKRFVKVVRVL